MNSGKQSQRRKLRFESIEEVLADIDGLVASLRLGHCNNWAIGNQAKCSRIWLLDRVWIRWISNEDAVDHSLDPQDMHVARILKNGMKPGVKIPGIANGTTGQDDQPIDQAADR